MMNSKELYEYQDSLRDNSEYNKLVDNTAKQLMKFIDISDDENDIRVIGSLVEEAFNIDLGCKFMEMYLNLSNERYDKKNKNISSTKKILTHIKYGQLYDFNEKTQEVSKVLKFNNGIEGSEEIVYYRFIYKDSLHNYRVATQEDIEKYNDNYFLKADDE